MSLQIFPAVRIGVRDTPSHFGNRALVTRPEECPKHFMIQH